MPAALIPFCAFQTSLTALGQTRQPLPFPACDNFQPTVLEGQLCYQLDLSLIAHNMQTAKGLRNGLVLVIDQGSQLSRKESQTLRTKNKISSLNLEPYNDEEYAARIYMNTLASFSDFRAGSYALSALKKIGGTSQFLELQDEVKQCQLGSIEHCQSKSYIEKVESRCSCVPWSLSSALPFLDPTFCSPADHACYSAIPVHTPACRISCTGLYADVHFEEDKLLSYTDNDLLKDLTEKGE